MSLSNFVKRVRNIMRNDAGINGDAQRIEQMAWMLFLKVYDEKENDWELDDDDYKSIIPEECRWRNWAHDDGSGNALTGDEPAFVCQQHIVCGTQKHRGNTNYPYPSGDCKDHI